MLVRWNAYATPFAPLAAFDGLNRGTRIEDALASLRSYPGPTQNFELADTSGRVAYQLAGEIPNDPLVVARHSPGMRSCEDLSARCRSNDCHASRASRDAIVWTSNNKMYGASYPLRFCAAFTAPCRAHRVAELLRARKTYDVAYFASMQMDMLSICERQLHYRAQLLAWDGRFTPDSAEATAAFHFALHLFENSAGCRRR